MEDLSPTYGVAATSSSPDTLVRDPSTLVSRKMILASGENVQRGTVLGKVASGGKLKTALAASSDGSQNPVAIAAETRDATGGDKEILIYTSGAFNGPCPGGLILGTGIAIATLRETFRALSIVIHENPVL